MLDVSEVPMGSYINLYKKESPSIACMGFFISSSKNFICVKEFYDYVFVGYNFLSYSEVFGIELNNNHQKIGEIASQEGWHLVEENFGFIKQVSNWSQLLGKCFEDGVYISCECMDGKFFIGRVISVERENFQLIPIGVDFFYKKQPVKIIYSDIKSITVGSKYIEVYQTYGS